jgi:ATP-dependent protease ClpP protease subunit
MTHTIDIEKFRHKALKSFEAPASALAKWQPEIHALQDDNAINIYSTVGDYGDGQGMTPKIVSSVLRKAKGDVTVNINSPGGDFFDGVAIYNLLREYDGKVNVKVVGLAASAASIIAMAGDSIEIAESGFFMIHNAWTVAIGNKNDMKEVADMLSKFDESMAKVYMDATGMDEKSVKKIMDAETWLTADESLDYGFAQAILDSNSIGKDEDISNGVNSALRRIDIALAKDGMPRSERRKLMKELSSTPSAAVDKATPSASDLTEALKALLNTIKKD